MNEPAKVDILQIELDEIIPLPVGMVKEELLSFLGVLIILLEIKLTYS